MATKTDTTARYRNAWQAGASGRPVPPGLAELADDDPNIDRAYFAGQIQEPFEQFLTSAGFAPAPSPAPSSTRSGPFATGVGQGQASAQQARAGRQSSVGQKVGSLSENLGSVLLGLIVAALALSVLDYGVKGPLYWFEAKFLNDQIPTSGASSASPMSTKPASSTPLATNAVLA